MLTAIEKKKQMNGHMLDDMEVHLDLDDPEPWVDIDYPASSSFISRGKTNVLGKMSDVLSKAKRIYSFDSDII